MVILVKQTIGRERRTKDTEEDFGNRAAPVERLVPGVLDDHRFAQMAVDASTRMRVMRLE
eukprot:3938131-Rhodomonas_salina.1